MDSRASSSTAARAGVSVTRRRRCRVSTPSAFAVSVTLPNLARRVSATRASETFTVSYAGNACINAVQVRELGDAPAIEAVMVETEMLPVTLTLLGVSTPPTDAVQVVLAGEVGQAQDSDTVGAAADSVSCMMVPLSQMEV